MSIRNLDSLMNPGSVALIGATDRPQSVGRVTAENLVKSGFAGETYFVNPTRESALGRPCYSTVDDLPAAPDLAVIASPPATVPDVIGALGRRGTRAAVVITAGLDATRKQQVLDAARPFTLRLLGPNCLGLLIPKLGLNASFAHLSPAGGKIAFVSQSGALLTAVLDWAEPRRIGFSHVISLGDMLDVDFGDILDVLALDGSVKAILLYMESVTQPRKFLSAARAAARLKPVVVVKAGRSAEGTRAAQSHTGALAGSDAVYEAAFIRAGVLRVAALEDLFEAAETLSKPLQITGDRLAILTNGGGMGVLATDMLIAAGGRLAELDAATIAALDGALPAGWSKGNPVDIIGDAPGARYKKALETLLGDTGTDAILVLNCPTAVAAPKDAAQAVITVARATRDRRIFTSWVGDATAAPARRLLTENDIPTYRTPSEAVTAFMDRVKHRRNQAVLMETPPSMPAEFAPDLSAARALIDDALAAGNEWMPTLAAKALLGVYNIPVIPTESAATAAEAGAVARRMDVPVAIKIRSPDITHKVDVGGVALNVDPDSAEAQAAAMLAHLREQEPEARIDGFAVEPMIATRDAHELILGLMEDRQFGPVVLFGQGGSAVEALDDTALGLPPLNLNLARDMMRRTRIWRLLQGYRHVPPADIDAIALLLVKIGQLASDFAEIRELDINPLVVRGDAVTAVDVRVRVAASDEAPATRLAISPYPRDLEQEITSATGETFFLRPITPMDEPALDEMVARSSPESLRLRFFAPLKRLPHQMGARLTQVDYDREIALVITERGPAGTQPVYATCRLMADPDNIEGEFAVFVRDDLAGHGLGRALLECLIELARARGMHRIFGDVLAENRRMNRLCDSLGCTAEPLAEDPTVLRRTLTLGHAAD